jgi:hypothetical protein
MEKEYQEYTAPKHLERDVHSSALEEFLLSW